jgi:hypothetical protein
MGKKSKPPPAPDYATIAREQATASQDLAAQQTAANRPNINTPFGSQTWQQTAGVDANGKPTTNWTQNTTLTPQLQGALDDQFAVQGARSDIARGGLDNLRSTLAQPVSFDGATKQRDIGATPTTGNLSKSLQAAGYGSMPDVSGTRQRAEDALYERQTRRLDPRFARDQSALEVQLANQGLARGTEAFDNAATEFNNTKEDAYSRAMLESIIGGGQEGERDFNMAVRGRSQIGNEVTQQANLDNQGFQQGVTANEATGRQRQQEITEMLQQRGIPLNEINALLSGQQVGMPTMPSFQGANSGAAPQLLSAAQSGYQGELDQYNARQQQRGSALSGLFKLGSAAMTGGASIPFML